MSELPDLPVSRHHIRLNVLILIVRLLAVLILANSVYGIIIFIFQTFDIFDSLLKSFNSGLWAIHLFVFLVETAFVVSITADWARRNYYLTGQEIIVTQGIISEEDTAYDLRSIRTVSVEQGWLGRRLNYGSIKLTLSASGGYHHEIELRGIKNPRQYERALRGRISESAIH